ncbi:phosphopentomutase [Candidatus Woesearchaeota archaeon]|nr:phosphopentomutase [Candidatus Woesearchaeota archaeon]
MVFRRIFIIVLDGCGIGHMPDADRFGDKGANTLVNLSKAVNGLHLPNLEKLGLGNIDSVKGLKKVKSTACYGKMAEQNPAKNTDAGHWEMMGFIKDPGFPVYPDGFPDELINEFEKQIGIKTLGNYPASGTEIIKKLGKEHLKTKKPIVYTSADSVFQIACHSDVYPVEELYKMCETARRLCIGKWEVGRVIARPFTGSPGNFMRINEKRKDYALPFDQETVLDILKEKGYETIAFGEVGELFNMKGITEYVHTKDNKQGIDFILKTMKKDFAGIVFGNLVDFDMLYGHRRNPDGFKKCIEDFDKSLKKITDDLKDNDLLILTADHGDDPTFKGTDHTREYVPLLAYGKKCRQNINLGIRKTFADLGRTIGENFKVEIEEGRSFLGLII